MEKIKRPGQNLSLRRSLVLYVAAFVLLALALSILTSSICDRAADRIWSSYPPSGEKYYLTNEQGEYLGEGTYIGRESAPLSEQDERRITLLELFPMLATPVYSALCILAAAFLFYRNRLKRPLAELREASEKIAKSDLDFSIECNSKDELGELVASFEIMRTTLANNFSEMWRQVEERKALNAAFAHDLRTPLTVLKGYTEMLQTSEQIQTRETAATMGKHLSRMEAYIDSMSRLRRLEDTRPECKAVAVQPFLSSLEESARILCVQNGKTLYLQNEVSVPELFIDTEFVSQVCNNLIANGVRYARTSVTLNLALQEKSLLLTVSDDGTGFDSNSLHRVTDPYFTEETDHAKHFGLGLYICRLLCEHHGGYLKLENSLTGAKVTACFNTPDL